MKDFTKISLLSLVFVGLSHASPITHPLLSDADIDNVIPEYFDNKRSSKKYHMMEPNISAGNLKQIHVSSIFIECYYCVKIS